MARKLRDGKEEIANGVSGSEHPDGDLKTITLVTLIFSTLVFGILLLPISLCSFTTPIFANFRQNRPIEVVEEFFLVFYFTSLPLAIIGTLVMAWIRFHKKLYHSILVLSLLPVTYLAFYYLVEYLFDNVLKKLPFL